MLDILSLIFSKDSFSGSGFYWVSRRSPVLVNRGRIGLKRISDTQVFLEKFCIIGVKRPGTLKNHKFHHKNHPISHYIVDLLGKVLNS